MTSTLCSPPASRQASPEPKARSARRTRAACRGCGGKRLKTILDFGPLPLANAFRTAEQIGKPESRYPLVLAFCSGCSLVQLTETIPARTLFERYLYFSSTSDTVLDASRELVERTIRERGLTAASHVLEIASNDGYLLQFYAARGIPALGIEPARNIARKARERGIPTLGRFFGWELAARLARDGFHADVIHANNVLAHAEDVHGFLAGIKMLLKPDGAAVIEVPYVKTLVERLEFDTIYHEHIFYFSLASLERLAAAQGMEIAGTEPLAIHGGSLRVTLSHAGGMRRDISEQVSILKREEERLGVASFDFYAPFAGRVESAKVQLKEFLRDRKARGARIAAYGASAKGTTLLNFCGIGSDILDFAVDRSPAKQGLFTPGTSLRISAPEKLLEAMPDYVLLLSWNFAGEILAQQEEYRKRGGKFILPIPAPQVI
ncbi:MAG TPA: class I SAM-dependent methyltransferase [Candidatus Micrarchaeaceae archaeon]|nr:class I SAM-dependent methyltransferase [Candidatus Micrarchaeaceae archaeon]